MSAATISEERMQKLADECKRNLLKFYYTFIALKFEDHCAGRHIKYLADKVTQCIYNPDFKNRLAIAMPPQHSKSSLVTVALPVWLTIRNPKLRILVVNAEKELSKTFGIQIRQLMHNIGPYYDMEVSNVQSSNTSLMFTKNGQLVDSTAGIKLTGISGGISGRPADVVIIDDPYKGIEKEFTPTALNHSWRDYSSLIEQRARTKTKMILLHTRWNSEDIQGRLLLDDYQKQKYEFIQLSAIANEDDPLGRKLGEPLWPEYYDINFYLDKQKTMGERQFQAIYQQKPLDLTSNFFYVNKIIWEDYSLDRYYESDCRSYDMAYTSENQALENNTDADYTAGCEAFKVSNDYYHFQDFLYSRLGERNINYIQNIARQDGLNRDILIETGTTGGAAQELFRLWDEDYLSQYPCHQSKPWGTKADRATALRYAMYDGKIHIHCNDMNLKKELLSQLKSFPNGKHDDLVDAMSYAILFLNEAPNDDIYGTGDATY